MKSAHAPGRERKRPVREGGEAAAAAVAAAGVSRSPVHLSGTTHILPHVSCHAVELVPLMSLPSKVRSDFSS